LSREDWKKLNQRFVQTKLAKTGQEVQKIWSDVASETGRTGKRDKQHQILTAWVIDPSCGSAFLENVRTLQSSEKYVGTEAWVSHKKIQEEYSDDELEEMLESGAIEVRKNPLNPRRLQYKKQTMVRQKEVGVKKSITLKGSKAVEDNAQWDRFGRSFDNVQLSHKMLAKGSKQTFAALGCPETSDDEEQAAVIVKGKNKQKTPSNPPAPAPEAKKPFSEMDIEELIKECSKLHGSIAKSILDAKNTLAEFKQCSYATPSKLKGAGASIDKCDKFQMELFNLSLASNKNKKRLWWHWRMQCHRKMT
jgi:hypothetical protein